jgi:hypothetical protein
LAIGMERDAALSAGLSRVARACFVATNRLLVLRAAYLALIDRLTSNARVLAAQEAARLANTREAVASRG